jgi:nitroreductase
MVELLHEIEIRRAKRALSEEKVPEDTIQRIMTAATYAPSCANSQSWRFVVINEEESLEKARIALSGGNYWAKKAPLLILVVTKPDLDCQIKDGREYALFDVGLATENLMLQAVKEGLIAHPIAGFKPAKLKEEFGIPEEYTLITIVVIGFPGDESHLNEKHLESEHSARDRKPESEVIMYNTWVNENPIIPRT